MRLFIAREAVDTHLKVAGDIIDKDVPMSKKLAAFAKAGAFYATWYPTRWIGWGRWPRFSEFGRLATHMRYAERTSRRLSRAIFHAMVRFGPKLERKQMVLFRAVDIGAELFAMSATCSRAHMLAKKQGRKEAIELADLFCVEARHRIAQHFRDFFGPNDDRLYKVSQRVLKGEHAWLEAGIVGMLGAVEGSRDKGSGVRSQGPGAERRGEKAAALI
jgi:hypothetical protein